MTNWQTFASIPQPPRDVAAHDRAAVRRALIPTRWPILIAIVVIAFGAAFAVGAATRNGVPARGASLASAIAAESPRAAVISPKVGWAVPALRAPAR